MDDISDMNRGYVYGLAPKCWRGLDLEEGGGSGMEWIQIMQRGNCSMVGGGGI